MNTLKYFHLAYTGISTDMKPLLYAITAVLATFYLGCKPVKTITTEDNSVPVQAPDHPFPSLMVKHEGDSSSVSLEISEARIEVKVTASLAITTMDILYANPTSRVLEGQWYLPLGEGQTVIGFAMEVNGKLREGVAVDRTKARIAYESTVRQQIDPGLAELSRGNHFKSRVYPIPANGYKRIVVNVQQELKLVNEGWLYQLPLNFKNQLGKFAVSVEVFKQEVEPEFRENSLSNLFFSRWEESYRASETYEDYQPEGLLSFAVPRPNAPSGVFVESRGDSSWFYLTTIPPSIQTDRKKTPRKIGLLWDISHSASGRKTDREIEVLNQYCERMGFPEIELIPFDIQMGETLHLSSARKEKLVSTLKAFPHDGATQMGVLDLSAFRVDEFLLFSDGISTFGKDEIILSDKPVYTFGSGNTVDYSYLKYIAMTTGGSFINLNENSAEEAVSVLGKTSLQFISAEYNRSHLSELAPATTRQVGNFFSLAGKLHSEVADITLNFGTGGKVLQTQTLIINREGDAVLNMPVHKIWATMRVQELDMRHEKNAGEIRRLGREYSLLTRETSLVVLDRVEDYVTHEIAPPSELRETYEDLLRRKKEAETFEMLSHLDLVAEAFYRRKEWWNTSFKIPEGPYQEPSKRDDADRESFGEAEEDAAFGDVNMSALAEPASEPISEKAEDASPVESGDITLNPWNPETPYLKALEASSPEQQYATYLSLKPEYQSTPAFFLDVADFFFRQGKRQTGLKILSNIAEMELENHELLRVLGRRLQQLEEYEYAIDMFRIIVEIRPEEPQSYRDLGLALAANNLDQAAVDQLYKVVKTKWNDRFPEIGVVAAHEMNALINRSNTSLDLSDIDDRLLADLPTDIRVVLDWDADAVDMDLWVTDPRGEKCYYQHQETEIGGMISEDFTGGYGPEEFLLKKAMSGKFKVQVNYYGTRQQRIAGPTNIQVKLITGYGRKDQKSREITLRLADESEVIDVGTFEF